MCAAEQKAAPPRATVQSNRSFFRTGQHWQLNAREIGGAHHREWPPGPTCSAGTNGSTGTCEGSPCASGGEKPRQVGQPMYFFAIRREKNEKILLKSLS